MEYVFKNRDNTNVLVFSIDGTPIDFTATTRMILRFEDGTEVDTDVPPGDTMIDYSAGSGEVTFKLGTLTIADQTIASASLIFYDAGHTNGQIITHAANREMLFRFFDEVA